MKHNTEQKPNIKHLAQTWKAYKNIELSLVYAGLWVDVSKSAQAKSYVVCCDLHEQTDDIHNFHSDQTTIILSSRAPRHQWYTADLALTDTRYQVPLTAQVLTIVYVLVETHLS